MGAAGSDEFEPTRVSSQGKKKQAWQILQSRTMVHRGG